MSDYLLYSLRTTYFYRLSGPPLQPTGLIGALFACPARIKWARPGSNQVGSPRFESLGLFDSKFKPAGLFARIREICKRFSRKQFEFDRSFAPIHSPTRTKFSSLFPSLYLSFLFGANEQRFFALNSSSAAPAGATGSGRPNRRTSVSLSPAGISRRRLDRTAGDSPARSRGGGGCGGGGRGDGGVGGNGGEGDLSLIHI